MSIFSTPIEFELAVAKASEKTEAKVMRAKKTVMPIELSVRHASGLELRNLAFAITEHLSSKRQA